MRVTTQERVLVVDDESLARAFAAEVLHRQGWQVEEADRSDVALSRLRDAPPQVMVSDIRMPDMDGLELLSRCREIAPKTEVVMVTAHADIETAVRAMQLGAFDFLSKPYHGEQLALRVHRALEHRKLLAQNEELRRQIHAREDEDTLVGQETSMVRLRERVRLVADSEASVLITGETGTGKELVARAIHRNSARREAPFVSVNCAALPESLMASELFGHERGSFTTAVQTRVGRFETANGGTLFLDEIADLPANTQGTLLRVLEEKRFERVGSSRTLQVDVRVIAATRIDLPAAVRAGQFREDLYFRLAVVSLVCPPLRERRGDIPLLAEHLLQRHCKQGATCGFSSQALMKLVDHDWPGNVRELENVITRAAIFRRSGAIQAEDVDFQQEQREEVQPEVEWTLEAAERAHVRRVLIACRWNRSETARRLGIDRSTLQRMIERFRLGPQDV